MKYPALFLFIFHACIAASQNMVPNPGFELYSECPEMVTIDRMAGLDDWYQPTKGSADYFNRCSKKYCGVPRNALGTLNAHTGNAYAGIICYLKEHGKKNYREYLEAQLTERMTKGHVYCIRMYVCLAGSSLYATNNIDALFSRFVVKSESDACLDQIPQLHFEDPLPMTDEKHWKEISGYYTSEGGERFMVIGNFQNDKHTAYTHLPKPEITEGRQGPYLMQYPEAYYYLDDVCVSDTTVGGKCGFEIASAVKDGDTLHVLPSPKITFELNRKLLLENIYFDTDRAILLPASNNELDKLYSFLDTNPGVNASITGHTDSQGTPEHNLLLSEARARAVLQYLVSKGISERRLASHGEGATKPVAENDTEQGRKMNRRVEVELVK
ncbi:MAG TPA: OmpA family protein [Bacteroidia bacterium]|jgi:outer membrane protein OmpA-like peptidoglycan-associated protein|nr:OmpA family protein [Bacteroidia bacterium]